MGFVFKLFFFNKFSVVDYLSVVNLLEKEEFELNLLAMNCLFVIRLI